jgi:hypothetical protein
MRTSYRDVVLLACCQALLLVNGAGWETMNAGALPFIAAVATAALWLALSRRRRGAQSSSARAI